VLQLNPAVAQSVMGTSGVFLVLLQIWIGVTAFASAEQASDPPLAGARHG
jgi:hypothetical protein